MKWVGVSIVEFAGTGVMVDDDSLTIEDRCCQVKEHLNHFPASPEGRRYLSEVMRTIALLLRSSGNSTVSCEVSSIRK